MLARDLPEIRAVVQDEALPYALRFVAARLAESLDVSAPLHRRGLAYCDPRAVVRDFTAAAAAYDANGGDHAWKLLKARLLRVEELLSFDLALLRQWPTEAQRLQSALRAFGTPPTPAEYRVQRAIVIPAAEALRGAIADPASGYRRYLTHTVATTATSELTSAAAKRRLEERVGLLAAMLLDEGHDAATALRRFAEAARRPQSTRRDIYDSLWARPEDHEVLVAVSGMTGRSIQGGALRIHSLRALVGDLHRFWPRRALLRFALLARAHRATAVVSVRLKARDRAHATRLARTMARELGVQDASADLRRRPAVLAPALTRRRGTSHTEMFGRPTWPDRLPPGSFATPPGLMGSMRYATRAAQSESDVSKVLDGWIAIEALLRERPGGSAHPACMEAPDLAWYEALRDHFAGPLQRLEQTPTADASMVLAHLRSAGAHQVEQRWLDLLDGQGDPDVRRALDRHRRALDPLAEWRLEQAQELLRHGKLLRDRLDRHRLHIEWMVRRLREQRNAIAHDAVGDQPFVRALPAFDTDSSAPTDARVLGGFAVALLTAVGEVAGAALQPVGTLATSEALLASARESHRVIRLGLAQCPRGQRALTGPPLLLS